MEFFNEHAVSFAILCGLIAIAVGMGLTWWLLKQPAGSERMQEIGRAIQEGAEAYLKRPDDPGNPDDCALASCGRVEQVIASFRTGQPGDAAADRLEARREPAPALVHGGLVRGR